MSRVRVDALGEATSLADRKRRAGQRLMLGFAGPAVDEDFRRVVREVRPAGFVLFGANLVEPAQIADLTRELASLVEPSSPALIGVDQEGGRVQRIPGTSWPTMRALGLAGDPPSEGGFTGKVARAIATELRALGFNLDFAPVADVDEGPVIGDRSFGAEPELVARHVAAFVRALQAERIIACAKHFPGHGAATQDSHAALPRVEKEEPDLEHTELAPFAAAVRAEVGAVMAAHVVYPVWDEDWPASLSARVAPRVLRRRLRYDGVLFSDDLTMQAVARWTPPELARRATLATVDVLLACKGIERQLELFRELVVLQEEEERMERRSTDAVTRVDALRERFFLDPTPPPPLSVVGSMAHRMLAEQVRHRSGIA
jgi:beta-N-acetylhexosaminidase